VLAEDFRRTPGDDPREVEQVIAGLVRGLADSFAVDSVGVGAAGWMDRAGGTVLFSPHLAWRREPLRDNLQKLLGRRVLVANDANAAAWAEWRFGAGSGQRRLVCITLGTGIGGAMVTDGRIEQGNWGVAGEFGHQILVPQGHRCECGNRGCWEQYASGSALGREARELAAAHSPVSLEWLRAAGGAVEDITGAMVTRLALAGNAASRDLLEDAGEWLGIGLANIAAALDPGMFVIGGGLCEAGDLLLEPARHAFARNLTGRGYRPAAPIRLAALGPRAGLVGAADMSRQDGQRPGPAAPGRC
jgi:glucokinase